MSWPVFLRKFGLFSLVILICGFGIARFDGYPGVNALLLISIISFSFFCLLIYRYARSSFSKASIYSSNSIVIISFVVKLLFSVVILLFFERTFSPEGNRHILHFLFLYIVYTIFEVYFLMKLSKNPLA